MPDTAAHDSWCRVAPPSALNGDLTDILATVDTLKEAWRRVVTEASTEFRAARERTLRRHAIETGIIERLYDVSWGVTEALVAEGLSADVAAREGGIDETALATIHAQFDALTYLAEVARGSDPLSLTLIRQLHAALCRTQPTFAASDQFGREVQLPLDRGGWKSRPNWITRQDGTVLRTAPPEQVAPEMERLVEYDRSAADLHPIVHAAWLHHAFACVHPFEDGNGRVARVLATLVPLRNDLAPLVIRRQDREEYLTALDAANGGNLRPLVRLFARREIDALRSELELPARIPTAASGAEEVSRAYVDRLKKLHAMGDRDRAERGEQLAGAINDRVRVFLDEVGSRLIEQFREVDPTAGHEVFTAAPPDERSTWWRAQIIEAARGADFFTNLRNGAWWSQLRLTLLGHRLHFVAVTQKVGHGETGVLAVTMFALTRPAPALTSGGDEVDRQFRPLIRPQEAESLTLVYTDDAGERWPELHGILDRTLAAAIAGFASGLS